VNEIVRAKEGRSKAATLVAKLSSNNCLGFENAAASKGTLLQFVIDEKEKHPEKLLLVRVGDFYETYGVDALMLVEYAGLNPMGGKCRAGCPIANVQPTLDDLTAAGLTVAVYEEMGPAKERKLKERKLSQVVSAASPTYLYERCLSPQPIDYSEPPPYVAVGCDASGGYALTQLYADSLTLHVHSRLSRHGLRALLERTPHAPPLLVSNARSLPPFLREREMRTLRAASAREFQQQAVAFVAEQLQVPVEKFTRLKQAQTGLRGSPRPVYVSTLAQIGLLPKENAGVPDLAQALLPSRSTAASVDFLRRWLSCPPRAAIADAMHNVCTQLIARTEPLPICPQLALGKLVRLISQRQANVHFFRDLRELCKAVNAALNRPDLASLNNEMLVLVNEESGVAVSMPQLERDTAAAVASIDSVLADHSEMDSPNDNDADSPNDIDADSTASEGGEKTKADAFKAFVRAQEAAFKDLVRQDRISAEHAVLTNCRAALSKQLQMDLRDGYEVRYDVRNKALHYVKVAKAARRKAAVRGSNLNAAGDRSATMDDEAQDASPQRAGADVAMSSRETVGSGPAASAVEYRKALDRNKKEMAGRFVSAQTAALTSEYRAACENAQEAVRRELQALCVRLEETLPSLRSSAVYGLLFSTLTAHVAHALQSGWALPSLRSPTDADRSLVLEGVWPFWLRKDAAVANSLQWEGIWLLTAPNMAGKSSLMRSMFSAALLANAGLMAPVVSATVPRYDCFFLRTSSRDAPAEGLSAFEQEMHDVAIMADECSNRSLIMLDELCRGTSSHEGAAIAVALLQWLESREMGAVFATHLHEVLPLLDALPKQLRSLQMRQMHVRVGVDGEVEGMDYTLQHGFCSHSFAVHAARKAGVHEEILALALGHLDGNAPDRRRPPSKRTTTRESVAAAATIDSSQLPECSTLLLDDSASVETRRSNNIAAAKEIGEEVLGGSKFLDLLPGEVPPPAAQKRSFVYLLCCSRTGTFYVGETDGLERRWAEHCRMRAPAFMRAWQLGDRSTARRKEAELISQLAKRGLPMRSTADAAHVGFGGAA